ncbi:Hypothetical predicted protein [Olea europaea subsp. europaea]|uniref:Uncharacterized protein n=1 Tax=Olea europaea subsp. europaea TaxID=158383 RepID=A0A8S0VL67_OLEEU|nr:Hypothetical predicted protein [Olea europaea subsp. europaea]
MVRPVWLLHFVSFEEVAASRFSVLALVIWDSCSGLCFFTIHGVLGLFYNISEGWWLTRLTPVWPGFIGFLDGFWAAISLDRLLIILLLGLFAGYSWASGDWIEVLHLGLVGATFWAFAGLFYWDSMGLCLDYYLGLYFLFGLYFAGIFFGPLSSVFVGLICSFSFGLFWTFLGLLLGGLRCFLWALLGPSFGPCWTDFIGFLGPVLGLLSGPFSSVWAILLLGFLGSFGHLFVGQVLGHCYWFLWTALSLNFDVNSLLFGFYSQPAAGICFLQFPSQLTSTFITFILVGGLLE